VAYTLTPGFASTTRSEAWTVWIDLNRDGDFADTGENVLQTAASTAARSGNITIPATASVGPSRMRIAMKRTSAQTSPTGTFSSGEVEDYSVQIGTNPTVNNAPYFLVDPIVMSALAQGSAMTGSLAGTAADWESQTLTFSKISGPAWLQVASNGSLSGTPSNSNVETGSYVVSVTDSLGAVGTAALSITVTNVIATPPDANGNGILDVWETAQFGSANSGSNAAMGDSDRDGLSNLIEYALDTDPLRPNGNPLVAAFAVVGADSFLRLTGRINPDATNLTYAIEVSSDLTPNSWTPVPTIASGNQLSGTDTTPITSFRRRFIHLKVTVK
jgi:hypothetical protein